MMDSETAKKLEPNNAAVYRRLPGVGRVVTAVVVLLCGVLIGSVYSNSAPREQRGFDVDDDWGSVRSTDVLIGSYPIETTQGRKFAWIGPTAKIALPFTGSEKNLNITGWIPFDEHRVRNGVRELIVEVLAGGRKLGDMRFDKQETFERSFSLAGASRDQNGNLIVELKSNSVLAPTQSDLRSLSIVVSKIWLE
jgi:hypothetical protein